MTLTLAAGVLLLTASALRVPATVVAQPEPSVTVNSPVTDV